MRKNVSRRHLLQGAGALAASLPVSAFAQEHFFAGKTMRLIVGTGAGAGGSPPGPRDLLWVLQSTDPRRTRIDTLPTLNPVEAALR